jgi:hypothetical protein
MDEEQLEYVKREIPQTYLFLICQTTYNPEVIALMKLAGLAAVQRRYEAGEPW